MFLRRSMMDEKQIKLFWNMVENKDPDECWNWLGKKTRDGYGALRRNGRFMSAHRASYEISTGDSANGYCVMHTCDNKTCVNPRHLKKGTHKENMQDMVAKGRQGKQLPRKKPTLPARSVLSIRRNYLLGQSKNSLAKEFGISTRSVRDIIKRVIRKDVAL